MVSGRFACAAVWARASCVPPTMSAAAMASAAAPPTPAGPLAPTRYLPHCAAARRLHDMANTAAERPGCCASATGPWSRAAPVATTDVVPDTHGAHRCVVDLAKLTIAWTPGKPDPDASEGDDGGC